MDKEKLSKILQIGEKKKELLDIETKMGQPDFWQKAEANQIATRYSQIKKIIDQFESGNEDDLKLLEQEALFTGSHDHENAILSISAGTGGNDACDCAGILEKMYLRFFEMTNLKTINLDRQPNEEGGIKNATYEISGENAYGKLKSENGTHRIVRKSPYNSQGLRQTSFVLVEVFPEITKTTVKINDKDLRIDTYRSAGAGGQSVNTTDSAVRITHIPTGLVVTCQNERSQLKNKETALKILKSRLQLLEEQKQKSATAEFKTGKLATWGNQIRSYVFDPYQMVKDHRTNYETAKINEVLNGNLWPFVESYLKSQKNLQSK
ncbi:MAG: peptide chain release factor-like protein [Patescibacteria group bacterium]|nr:peptide chain release factor-like protein [Patescibacteria group bacterium]